MVKNKYSLFWFNIFLAPALFSDTVSLNLLIIMKNIIHEKLAGIGDNEEAYLYLPIHTIRAYPTNANIVKIKNNSVYDCV